MACECLYIQRYPYTQSTQLPKSEMIKEVSTIRTTGAYEEERYVGLCTLPELWSKMVQIQNNISKTAKTAVWTNQSCDSCWLNHLGYCDDENKNDDTAWRTQYQMIATLMAGQITTGCLKGGGDTDREHVMACSRYLYLLSSIRHWQELRSHHHRLHGGNSKSVVPPAIPSESLGPSRFVRRFQNR